MDDFHCPNLIKLYELFERLPPGSREEAEEIALYTMREFAKLRSRERFLAPLGMLREVGNQAMFDHLIKRCNTSCQQALCREAFGLSPTLFKIVR
jgi:hypothetical protein